MKLLDIIKFEVENQNPDNSLLIKEMKKCKTLSSLQSTIEGNGLLFDKFIEKLNIQKYIVL
jgi:hypothetical protein